MVSKYFGHLLFLAITLVSSYPSVFLLSIKMGDPTIPPKVKKVLENNGCLSCHQVSYRLYGPSFEQIALKEYPDSLLFELIRNPNRNNWPGFPPMPPNKTIGYQEVQMLSEWLDAMAKSNTMEQR